MKKAAISKEAVRKEADFWKSIAKSVKENPVKLCRK